MKRIPTAIARLLSLPGERGRFVYYWFLVLSFLLLVPNIALILELTFNQPLLSPLDKLGFLTDIYASVIRFFFEPVTFSIFILSVVLAVNFQVIRFMRNVTKSTKGRVAGTLTMLISSHCIACGGSLLAPLISLVGGTGGSYIGAGYSRLQMLTIGLNVLAIMIALRSIYKAAPTLIRITSIPNKATA